MARVLAIAVLVLGLAAVAAGQTDFGSDPARYLKLDWQAETRGSGAVVWGHVFNDFGLPARDIRILVEGLDESGRPVARGTAWVPFIVTPGTRGYWEAAVPRAAASYRASVIAFSWVTDDEFGILRRRWR